MNIEIPKSVKVGPYTFKVYARSRAWYNTHGVFGNMVADTLEINVCGHLAPIVTLDTLLHEILHAVYYVYHLDDKDDEERIVSTLATAMTGVYRDNPFLCAYQSNVLRDYHVGPIQEENSQRA